MTHGTYGLAALEVLVDDLETRLTAVRAGYLDQLDFALQEAIAAIPTVMVGTNNAALAASWTGALATALAAYTAVRGAYLDELAAANIPADIDTLLTRLSAVRAGYLDNIAATAAGRAQIAATTIDLNQAAATYDLFTGTTQVVILESLNIKMPTGAAGGALTSISIQTDDATPGVIINSTDGAVANLTSEAGLGWIGTLYITVGTKIRLTIGGGAHGAAYVCNVTAKCRAVVAGGNLA